MSIMDADALAREFDDRVTDLRWKLHNYYYVRNFGGIRISGRKGLYIVALDELDRYTNHLIWRYAKWGVKGEHLQNQEQAFNAALKYLLKEMNSLFNPNRFPSWVLYPYGVNQNRDESTREILEQKTTPEAPPENPDFEEEGRLNKALRWAKRQTLKEMRLTSKSLEAQYLDFVVGIILSGKKLSISDSKNTPLDPRKVRLLKDRFKKFLRRWYSEKYPKLIYEILRAD